MRRLAPAALLTCAFLGGSAWAHSVDEELAAAEQYGADARSLLQAFRESGDDRYLDTAWELVEDKVASGASANVLINAALIAQARHRFDEARRLVSRATSLEPGNDQGWMLVNAISLVQDRTDEAADACRRLRHSPPLAIVTCHARVALVTGKGASVAPRLEALLELGSTDESLLSWSHSIAGDLAAALDDEVAAIRHYQHSLALAESTQVRSALVDAFLRCGRWPEARNAIDAGSHHALPLEVRRMIVDRHEGRVSQHRIDHVDERFRAWVAENDWLHAREMARFYLDVMPVPVLARDLAVTNFGIQKEPEDRRLLQRTASFVDAGFSGN